MADYTGGINNIPKMIVGSQDWQTIHTKMGEVQNSQIDDDELLFKTMQYYEVSNRSDNWSAEAQELSIEELIEKWKEFDKDNTSFAKDFDDFDAYMVSYKSEEPPVEEDIIRPYIPKPLTPEQEARMHEFDKMRAEDSHANLDKEGDYELLLEYVRQREGTSFLYPSDYNADGTVNDKGKAKEAEMIAKLAEIDKGDNDIGDILEEFLKAYDVEEPTGAAQNGELPDGLKAEVADVKAGESKEITIGDNVYLITNNGADGNKLSYEVKTNKQGDKYLEMNGDNWRIQDISGKLQDDLIQMNGEGNELDLGLGDDIAYLVGNNNRALMGDGDDKVYIEGDNVFTDLWRGDDQLFNINSNNTMGVGFTGDDEMYIKGDNVTVSGENNTAVGDGIYKDGEIKDHEIENTLTKPDWFPGPDEPGDDDPTKDNPGIVDDGPKDIEIDGITYRVYKKTSRNEPTDVLKYYKADDGRTVFESNGWDITVVSEDNTTGDGKYADVVVTGDRNSFHGSLSEDAIEIQGNDNNIYGDYSHTQGGDDVITVESGTNNFIYGEVGSDTVITKAEGNFFNEAILDVEKANGEEQDLTPPQKESAWKTVTEPNESQLAQMQAARDAFDLPDDATFKKVQQNGSTMGMSYNSQAYLSKTNADGTIASVTKKDNGVTLAKVEFTYKDGKVATTTTTDYENNTITVVDAEGNKTVTKYEDVKAQNKQPISQVTTSPDGTVLDNQVIDKENNTITVTTSDGSQTVIKYDDVMNGKPISSESKDAKGNVIQTETFDYDKDISTITKADGSKFVTLYDDLNVPSSIQETKSYDKDGKLVETTTYKRGKEDMKFPEGNVMSLSDFFNLVDLDKDSVITEAEIKKMYNKTNDPVLKGILNNFTDGNSVTFAYKLAATGTGEAAYKNDKVLSLSDATAMISDGKNITSAKIAQLQTNAAYASLVGYELNNSWYVNGNDADGTMDIGNPAYALTNKEGTEYDDMTMVLLNAAGGRSVNRDDLAKFEIKTVEDYNNKELFTQLRQGADLVSAVGFKVSGWNVSSPTAREVLATYEKATDENVKKACIATGLIEVGSDGVARVANGKTADSKLDGDVRDFYKKVLADIVGYEKLPKTQK